MKCEETLEKEVQPFEGGSDAIDKRFFTVIVRSGKAAPEIHLRGLT